MSGSGKASPVIRTPEHRLRVFVSSTLKELEGERIAVREAILRLRLVPVMFEAGARPYPARELYQAYLSQSHIFIGIYWQNYGWVGPGMDISGLEDEYNLSTDLPRLIYIKGPAPAREEGLSRMLARLQNENTSSYKHFSTPAELGELVQNDLALLLTESFESAHVTGTAELTPRPLTNIPIPRNPLIGREHELETILRWISQDDTGLVTLTGTGGTGKSRLALEAALALRDGFSDGAYLVRLSPVKDAERVTATIAETLGLRESAQGRPLYDILIEFLRDRQVLLLLDNFEQILTAAPQVANLLESCPRVKALVTSRAPLHIRGERELQIRPLTTPDQTDANDLQRLSQYASVALFIQRAQTMQPDFRVSEENAPAIAEICFRLDGLPLAIELAAARIRLLSPGELLTRLEHRFTILRGGTRDLPERHQTLRAAIDWSYYLLSETARALFRQLAVFSGGWSLEAAETVCTCADDAGLGILDELEALVDMNLLTHSEGRFGMLETIREYALERLVESGEEDRMRRRHAEYFLRFASKVEPRIRSAERTHWQRVMEQDLNNIRAAIQWSISIGDDEHIGERILITLLYFWVTCGYLSEGRQYAEQVAENAADVSVPTEIRAGLKLAFGGLAILRSQNETAMPILLESVDLARKTGDMKLLANCLLWAGSCALTMLNLPLASALLEEGLALLDEIGDEWLQVLVLLWLSNVAALQGDTARRQELFDRTLLLAERQGDPWRLVAPLADVAQDAFMRGDLLKTETTLLRMESILREVGDRWTLSWVLNELGQVALTRGQFDAARRYFLEGLGLARENGNMIVLVFSLAGTAALMINQLEEGQAEQRAADDRKAARLCGAVKPFFDHPLLLGGPGLKEVCKRLVDQVHAQVDESVWEPAFAEGTATPLDQALLIAEKELREDLS